ncbi:MAG: polysaccharide biosynthesis tyrosine autokinase [Candidatus Rokubacteria bacterium]|nr:polysaccharide biosynthesis tyrosine autokinase [Candidatus Rokubacteria bacterium]
MEAWQIIKRLAQGIWRRRKLLAVLTFMNAALVLGPAVYYLSDEPPRFRTLATILVESRPDRVPVFQEFLPFRPLPVQLAILNSRSLAEGVLESLPKASFEDLIESPYYVDYYLHIKNVYRRLVGLEPEVESPQRRALKELQNARVSFDARAGHGIVYVTAEASKPQVAVDIAGTYIEVLLSRTRSFNIDDARVSREFLENQAAEVRKSLQASEEALRAFTVGHGGIRVPEQSQATVTRLSQAETALAEVAANRKMVEARLQRIREKVEVQERTPPPMAAPVPAAPRPIPVAVQRLRERLSRLESALLDLRTKYTDEHPRVVLVKDEIAELQRELSSVVKETTPVTPAPAAVPPTERVNFTEQVLALETSFHALTAQEEALRKQAEGLKQSLTGLTRSEMEYARLVREVESSRNLYTLLSDRLTGARIREQGEMKVVKVIDPPSFSAPVANERRLKFGGLALLLALAFGGGVPAAVEWVRRPVETEEDVQEATGLPVLAAVPQLRGQEPWFLTAEELQELGRGRQFRASYFFSEAFRSLRAGVQLAARGNGRLRTLLVTSVYPREGKSMVVVNLGAAFGEAGRRVVLADTDILRPALHELLNVKAGAGLVDVLHARREVEQTLIPVGDGISLAPCGGELQPSTRGIFATSRLKELLDELATHGDVVLCDSSPVLAMPDNLFLGAAVDGVILVIKAGQASRRDVARAKVALEGAGAHVLGVVLNEVPASAHNGHYDRYHMVRAREQEV